MTPADFARMTEADALAYIATELGMCVSLLRTGELDTERLIALRDYARRAVAEGETHA